MLQKCRIVTLTIMPLIDMSITPSNYLVQHHSFSFWFVFVSLLVKQQHTILIIELEFLEPRSSSSEISVAG
jgi:hypothetical protein